MKKELSSALTTVLFDDHSPRLPTLSGKAAAIISLCGYYCKESMPENIQNELVRLNFQQQMLITLERLLKALEQGRSNDFMWDPHFHREHIPANLTLSPTFNIQRDDESSIVAEIEKIRNELQQQSVNIGLLISHIGTMAREAGDLKFEEND